ncbi:CDGSH iron-sulfur domain-containing protein [Streptomyces sp. NPDC008122]|uniref:CDGSH iron-sulfur domain-containing protein n=1 Tax=Streptomyces sp. NPDC008122 TaxID=3364810 RepID=UPI0036EBB0B0
MPVSPNEDTPQARPAEGDGAGGPGPRRARSDPPRIRPLPEGPLLVEGPAEIVVPDGTVIRCEWPVTALCTCRRSLRAPFRDTSHRPRVRRRSHRATGKAKTS